MTVEPESSSGSAPCVYHLLLIERDKVATLEKQVSVSVSDMDNDDLRPVGLLLPTAREGIYHAVPVIGSSFGNRLVLQLSTVDAWGDLSLSISDALEKLRENGWKVASPDYVVHWDLRAHFKHQLKVIS